MFCDTRQKPKEFDVKPGPQVARVGGMLVKPSVLAETVIECAIDVHRALGPGLLESAYAACLAHEFTLRDIPFRRQVPVPIVFKGIRLDCGYRADFVVDDEILIELKSVECLLPLDHAQVLTYLKLLELSQGLLINFNVRRLVDGLRNLLG